MNSRKLGKIMDDDLYKSQYFDANSVEPHVKISNITDRDKFTAAKQILFGIAVLYVFTISAYLYKPKEGEKLLDIITITFPPLTTLILAAYFRDKQNG